MVPGRPSRIAALDPTKVDAAFVVRARILEVDASSILLADASGQCWCELNPGSVARNGDWIVATLECGAGGWQARDSRVLASSTTRGLNPSGDARRLLGRPGRLKLLEDRARCLRAIRDFFDARGFVEVETPTLVSNPGMDVHLDAFRVGEASENRWLATSPEYAMKRLVSAGMERIYQLTRGYRRDEAGDLHEPEFSIVEWYRAFASADDTMQDTEALVAHVIASVNEGSANVIREGTPLDFTPPWPRLRVADALALYAGADLATLRGNPDRLFELLGTVVQPALGVAKPTWLVDWPIELASLARPKPGEPDVAERFEAYARGIELCNGFGELTCPLEQRRRFVADADFRRLHGKDEYALDERFLTALDDGLPECSGNALGVDRLVMLATGATTISDVRAFLLTNV